jgi:hypothetical protein
LVLFLEARSYRLQLIVSFISGLPWTNESFFVRRKNSWRMLCWKKTMVCHASYLAIPQVELLFWRYAVRAYLVGILATPCLAWGLPEICLKVVWLVTWRNSWWSGLDDLAA